VKRPGWNPTKRNRNIGTNKAGRGQDNRLVIPSHWTDFRVFWSRLQNPIHFELGGFTFLVEPCTEGFAHSVTVHDIARVLRLLPHDDVARIRIIALRQPTKKQRILSSVWGRLAYFADFGETEGPAVILEAQRLHCAYDYPKSLSPDAAEELECIRNDGHEVTQERRAWKVATSPAAVRQTQLFRTLPHEVGHYVQYDREVRQAAQGDPDELDRLNDLYFTKPTRDKEDFAHRYAREFMERMREAGECPFEPLVDRFHMKQFGMDPAWFGLSS